MSEVQLSEVLKALNEGLSQYFENNTGDTLQQSVADQIKSAINTVQGTRLPRDEVGQTLVIMELKALTSHFDKLHVHETISQAEIKQLQTQISDSERNIQAWRGQQLKDKDGKTISKGAEINKGNIAISEAGIAEAQSKLSKLQKDLKAEQKAIQSAENNLNAIFNHLYEKFPGMPQLKTPKRRSSKNINYKTEHLTQIASMEVGISFGKRMPDTRVERSASETPPTSFESESVDTRSERSDSSLSTASEDSLASVESISESQQQPVEVLQQITQFNTVKTMRRDIKHQRKELMTALKDNFPKTVNDQRELFEAIQKLNEKRIEHEGSQPKVSLEINKALNDVFNAWNANTPYALAATEKVKGKTPPLQEQDINFNLELLDHETFDFTADYIAEQRAARAIEQAKEARLSKKQSHVVEDPADLHKPKTLEELLADIDKQQANTYGVAGGNKPVKSETKEPTPDNDIKPRKL